LRTRWRSRNEAAMSAASSDNPLLAAWTGPFEVPPFGQISAGHFRPAFDRAMADQRGGDWGATVNCAILTVQILVYSFSNAIRSNR
jgi:Zn-dependent oligopeptidase